MQIRHDGTTLLEALIALGLLAGLLVAASGLLPRGSRQIRGGADTSRGLAIARTIVEQIELWSHESLVDRICEDAAAVATCGVVSSHPVVAAWEEQARAGLSHPAIEIRLEAVDAATIAAAHALRVTVRVEWREGSRARSVRLSTLRI